MTKVIVKNLGRHGALGLADTEKKVIEIDPRQKPKQYLDTLIHEALHISFPDMSETKVKRVAKEIRDIVWDHNYRWVDL
jgi:hypothetical protein